MHTGGDVRAQSASPDREGERKMAGWGRRGNQLLSNPVCPGRTQQLLWWSALASNSQDGLNTEASRKMSFPNSWILLKASAVVRVGYPNIKKRFISTLLCNGEKESVAAMAVSTSHHLSTVASDSDKTPHVKKLSIEGNIAVGKSTFLTLLGKSFQDWHMVTEPVNKWQDIKGASDPSNSKASNLLHMVYEDPSRWSYTFQTFSCISRFKSQLEPFPEQLLKVRNPVQIFERSVYSDRYVFAKNLFDLGEMSEVEWVIYQDWHSFLVQQFKERVALDGILYLQATPEKCFERLHKRGRMEEKQVQLTYLESLHEQHECWLLHKSTEVHFENLTDVPVLLLDVNEDFKGNPVIEETLVHTIKTFLESL